MSTLLFLGARGEQARCLGGCEKPAGPKERDRRAPVEDPAPHIRLTAHTKATGTGTQAMQSKPVG